MQINTIYTLSKCLEKKIEFKAKLYIYLNY
jgi:hypothetical protein